MSGIYVLIRLLYRRLKQKGSTNNHQSNTGRKKVSQSPSSRVFPQPQNMHFVRLSVWLPVPLFAKYPGLVNDLQILPAALSLTHTRSDIMMHPLNTQQLDGVAPLHWAKW